MTLLKGSTILFITSMVGNVANYFFQFYMSRYLSVDNFGAMSSLLSLMVITSVPSAAILLIITKYSSEFKARDEIYHIQSLLLRAFKHIGSLALVILMIFLASSDIISTYLQIDARLPIILIGLAIFFSLLSTINMGILQGLQRFLALGVCGGLSGVFRLVIGAVFVYLGLHLNGALLGILLAALLALVISFFPLRHVIASPPLQARWQISPVEIISYGIPVTLTSLTIMALTNVDLVMVKHYFPPQEAGYYAACAVLGRTVFYLPGVIVMAMFPMVSEGHTLNRDTSRLLQRALSYTFLMAAAGAFILLSFPELMLITLFGERFETASHLLRLYAVAMLPVGLINILANYSLARRKIKYIYLMLSTTIAEIVLIHFLHASLAQVIHIVIAIGLFLLVGLLWIVIKDYQSDIKPAATFGREPLLNPINPRGLNNPIKPKDQEVRTRTKISRKPNET
jgi:O-antigen/teichoic acid export membrane protein